MFPKTRREVDADFIRWVHGWPCCICGAHPVQAHHVDHRGSGGSDRTCIPLCASHHTMGGKSVHRMGKISFQKHHGISFEEKIQYFNSLYEKGARGPYQGLLPDGELRAS